jgi:hypothetical protein
MLLTVAACATDLPAQIEPVAPLVDTFCSTYVPVYSSVRDTEETKRQIDKNNAVWLQRCEKSTPPVVKP